MHFTALSKVSQHYSLQHCIFRHRNIINKLPDQRKNAIHTGQTSPRPRKRYCKTPFLPLWFLQQQKKLALQHLCPSVIAPVAPHSTNYSNDFYSIGSLFICFALFDKLQQCNGIDYGAATAEQWSITDKVWPKIRLITFDTLFWFQKGIFA